MMNGFIGRKEEIKVLTESNWRDRASLAVVYGRRRVGKTALIEYAYQDRTLWKFEGLENASTKTQLDLFCKELSIYSADEKSLDACNWDDALRCLSQCLESYKKRYKKPVVVFFDEFQWMCEMKTDLVSLFKYHWDNYLSKHKDIMFMICGSISSFIVKKVIQSRALYGRVDLELHLLPLSLKETEELISKSVFKDQSLDLYMVLGGIPQYLKELNPQMSLIQNLNEYAFKSSGYFFKEFDRLFISHFASHPIYEKILKTLAKGSLTFREISMRCHVEAGGGLSQKLEDLQLAGFLHKETPVDKSDSSRLIKYKLNDEYLHFYFTFIAPFSADIVSGKVNFTHMIHNKKYMQWQGYAFERLCRKHADKIAQYLRFDGINYRCGAWFNRKSNLSKGAQVDLLFLRGDRVITICETKYVDELSIRPLKDSLNHKLSVIKQAFPSYALETVLILGKTSKGINQAKALFNHVLLAEKIFC